MPLSSSRSLLPLISASPVPSGESESREDFIPGEQSYRPIVSRLLHAKCRLRSSVAGHCVVDREYPLLAIMQCPRGTRLILGVAFLPSCWWTNLKLSPSFSKGLWSECPVVYKLKNFIIKSRNKWWYSWFVYKMLESVLFRGKQEWDTFNRH